MCFNNLVLLQNVIVCLCLCIYKCGSSVNDCNDILNSLNISANNIEYGGQT